MRWFGKLVGVVVAQELAVLLGVFVVVGGTWGFIELADQVKDERTQKFDDWAIRSLRRADDPRVPIGPAWTQEVARDLTALGGVAVLLLATTAVLGFFVMRRAYASMGFLLVATLGGLGLSVALKGFFNRPRPQLVEHLSQVYTSSFPSGHSMLSAVVYLTLGALLARLVHNRRSKVYILIVALSLTFLVGVSRVFMGVHYPTDVLAGWTAGLVWAVVCWLVAKRLSVTSPSTCERCGRSGDGTA
ncbi:MAG: phosphatase PAP2 family protein [Tepidisphaerales bacterium]